MEKIPYETFAQVDIRVGRVIDVQDFPEARKPAYKLTINFGPDIGTKRSSAQVTELYSKDDLLDRQVLAVVNFEPKQIGPFMSECLTLGVNDAVGNVALLSLDREIPLGSRMY